MKLRIAMAFWDYPRAEGTLEGIGARARRAADAGADLLVFPERLMYTAPPTTESARQCAEPLDGPFVTAVSGIARECSITLVVPIYETDPKGGLPFNTCVVVDADGEVVRAYRKCHLYDAHGISETEATQSGDALADPFEVAGAKVGLGTCYDLRFPEVARAAAVAGADLVLFPAAWIKGPRKLDHWETLINARAIENELFCVGVCHMAADCVGVSHVAGPMGETVQLTACASATGETLLWHADLDLALVGRARENMDVLGHRRPSLYGAIAR